MSLRFVARGRLVVSSVRHTTTNSSQSCPKSLHLSDTIVMLKVSMNRPNIRLPCALIRVTTCERSDINIFISDVTPSADFDCRTLKKR